MGWGEVGVSPVTMSLTELPVHGEFAPARHLLNFCWMCLLPSIMSVPSNGERRQGSKHIDMSQNGWPMELTISVFNNFDPHYHIHIHINIKNLEAHTSICAILFRLVADTDLATVQLSRQMFFAQLWTSCPEDHITLVALLTLLSSMSTKVVLVHRIVQTFRTLPRRSTWKVYHGRVIS